MTVAVRINVTEQALKFLEKNYITKGKTNPLKDIFLKPKNMDLKDFNPNNKILRIRVTGNNAVLTLVLFKENSRKGYDLYSENEETVLKLANQLGFEVWGKLEMRAVKYKLRGADVFLESFNEIGNFLRIESDTQVSLDNNANLLNAENIIKGNQAVLLAEKLNLI